MAMIRLIIIFSLGVCLSLPAFLGDFFVAHDLLFHLNWNRAFSEQFWNGDIYPRWLESMNGGRGSPVFFFYGPVPFFISSLFKPLLADDPHGWLQLGFSTSIALVLSGFFAYLWLAKVVDQRSAFMGAIVYMALPYHLMVDLFYRFSLAEFWSFVWLPLIIYATNEIIHKKEYGILKFSIGYALLVMTHLPSTLIFSVVPPAYAVILSAKGLKIKNLSLILIAISVGIGLSSIYLIPALFTQDNVNMPLMTLGKLKYYNNFLKYIPNSGEIKVFSTYLFQVTTFTVFITVLCYWKSYKCLTGPKNEGIFWLSVVVISLCLMFPISKTVWENISIIQKIQFPWRLNILICISTTAIVARTLHSEQKTQKNFLTGGHLAVSSLIFVLVFIGMNVSLKRGNERIEEDQQRVFENSLKVNLGAPEYLPRWLPELTKRKIIFGNIDNINTIMENPFSDRNVKLDKNEPGYLEIEVAGSTDSELTIGQFYYPGWTAIVKDELKKLPVEVSKEGLLNILVPSGRHRIVIRLEPTIEERLGQVVSSIFAFSCVVLCVHKKYASGVSFP